MRIGQVMSVFTKSFFYLFGILFDRTNWGQYHFIGPMIFFIVGMVLNTLCFTAFRQTQIRQNIIGMFFLVNSIISQFVLLFLLIRVVYLHLARQIIIETEMNRRLCKSLPYLMLSFDYVSLWLTALVTVERALMVTLPMRFRSLRSSKSAFVAIIFVCLFVFGSNYIHIDQYRLISHPDDPYPWCISEIKADVQYFTQYVSLAHQIIPFLINFIAGLVIIFVVNQSKASSHHLQARRILVQEVRKRIELLLGPTICFITQLPQVIILFLDICHYNLTSWFIHLTMLTYYTSFTPQISLFFLYVLPSPLYRGTLLKKTSIGKQLVKLIPLLTRQIK